MNYIVMDLEWNQSNTGQEKEVETLPFEIIEIGAVKLDAQGLMISEFSELIKPRVYTEMHRITSKLIHLQMQELERGGPFEEIVDEFLKWCGDEYMFCTWGNLDLLELQRNMKHYNMTPLSEGPIAFLDVQKLFSLAWEDGKSRRALEYAIDKLQIEKDIPFHRAFSDAYYTAEVLRRILREKQEVMTFVSYDVYKPPVSRETEIKVQFDGYMKYISREFGSKAEAFADKEVSSSKCYLCRRNLRKKIKWFTPNAKNYYCLAYCETHGYLKGKIRMRKSATGKVFVVKTIKLITPEDAENLKERCRKAKELHKKKMQKTN